MLWIVSAVLEESSLFQQYAYLLLKHILKCFPFLFQAVKKVIEGLEIWTSPREKNKNEA